MGMRSPKTYDSRSEIRHFSPLAVAASPSELEPTIFDLIHTPFTYVFATDRLCISRSSHFFMIFSDAEPFGDLYALAPRRWRSA